MVRKYTGNKASVKTAEALAREGLKQEEKAEKMKKYTRVEMRLDKMQYNRSE